MASTMTSALVGQRVTVKAAAARKTRSVQVRQRGEEKKKLNGLSTRVTSLFFVYSYMVDYPRGIISNVNSRQGSRALFFSVSIV